jgi:cytochrome bd ubiquinol oxidase subunit II
MIFDVIQLQLIWWALIVLVLIFYATTSGYDFGVTMYLPFRSKHKDFSKDDLERRMMINTVAPTWDGNQTWLVFAGGVLFGVWPAVYGTLFSGLYFAFLLILYTFFLRPPGFDFRSKLPGVGWRKMWDWSLWISAFFPVIVFGLVIGNLFVGLPFYHDDFYLRSVYYGSIISLFNPFGILIAVMGLCMTMMHAGLHLNRRLEESVAVDFRRRFYIYAIGYLVTVTIAWAMLTWSIGGYILASTVNDGLKFHSEVNVVLGGWLHNYALHPWMWIAPFVVYAGVVVAMLTARINKALAFWGSCFSIAALLVSAGFALFPFIVPSGFASSSVSLGSQSLTLWNISSASYTLMGMLYICLPLVVIAIVVKLLGMFSIWKNKPFLSVDDVKQNSHTFY